MATFEVGKLLQDGVTRYQEGMKFDFYQTGPSLYIFFNAPTDKEIQSIKDGKLEIGFYEKDEVILFLAKFQGLEWMDAPYSVHLSKPFEFEQITEGSGFGFTIFLTDANTGVLKVIRLVGLPTVFSKKLKLAIENQKNKPFDNVKYNQKINGIFGNYSTDDLALRAEKFKIK